MKLTMRSNTIAILGIGNDIIEIERVRLALKKHGHRLMDRLLSEREKAYCLAFRDPAMRLAGRFAAKEAIVKALGCGFGDKVGWLEIEIINNPEGKPEALLATRLKEHFAHPQLLISISHCKSYATAVAIWSAV